MRLFRRVAATIALAVAATAFTATAASADVAPAALEDDSLPPVITGDGPPAGHARAFVAATTGAGYSTDYTINYHSYAIRLVASPRVEQYRSVIAAVADELNSARLANLYVQPGQVPSIPSRPEAGVIYFTTQPSSPCGVTNVAGCAQAWANIRADANTLIADAGIVYILPITDPYSFTSKRHVVGHEIGHALGLNHYEAGYAGQTQIMHPSSYANSTFQSGDRSGLAALARNTAPTGTFTAATGGRQQLRITGAAYDPDQIAAVALNVTVNGANAGTYRPNGATTAAHPYGPVNFDLTIGATPGSKSVCVTAINYPAGANTNLGCKTATVSGIATATRTYGSDRFETAVAVAKQLHTGHADTVYVASGVNYPDALSAAPAAANAKAPLLLTNGKTLTASVTAAIRDLTPNRIVIVGGPASVSESVANTLRTLAPTVDRMNGADRYESSRHAVTDQFATAPTVYIATGENFPDALIAATAAAGNGQPLLLVNGNAKTADAATKATLSKLGTTKVIAVGGPGSTTDELLQSLRSAGLTVSRLSGADRFTTATAVARATYPTADTVYLTSGLGFADGVYGAVIAGVNRQPMLLSMPSCIPTVTSVEIGRSAATSVNLIGGPGTLNANVAAMKVCAS